MKKIFITTLLICTLVSCSNKKDGFLDEFYTESFILEYLEINGFEAIVDGNKILIYESLDNIGKSYRIINNTDENTRDIYKTLQEKYGDKGYNTTLYYSGYWPCQYMANDIVSIKVTAQTDYNQQFPAGSSLDEITRLYSLSPYRYIRSNYTLFDWTNYNNKEKFGEYFRGIFHGGFASHNSYVINTGSCYPINKLLSDIRSEDLILLGRGRILSPDDPLMVIEFESPSNLSSVGIIIKIENSAGNIFELPVRIN